MKRNKDFHTGFYSFSGGRRGRIWLQIEVLVKFYNLFRE